MFNLDSEEALTSVGAFFVLKRKAMWLTKILSPNGGKVVNLSGLAENKAVNCIVK